ncbi:MAG: hypothetical protein A3I01_10035 [Betaproteobacteria bacterium RIFCSPLOWO2_02_FULL_65_24]|nr:MAG: hypothetical protein A3I01_10035 [Betaproteobacteria bacterium RIFCSPLOWO2_02_FULL_65_24]OGA31032.1 MAG: hypothetical protein A3G80_14420 [Betaproteobacteria bacterium RIFCSPLOWO2_12_FULL_62_13b]
MYKILRMVKRKKGMTLEQFKQYWLTRHAELHRRAMNTTPVRKVVASFSTGEVALGGAESQFDGMTAIYFDTLEDLRAARASEVPKMMADDERNFVDHVPMHVVAEEFIMSQKPGAGERLKKSGQLKIIRTVYRRKDLTLGEFKDYWLKNHSRLEDRVVKESPTQYIVATFAVPQPGEQAAIDGMVELYYDSVQDIRAMFAGPIPQMMREDEQNFVQMDAPAIRAVCEEHVIAER